MVTYKSTRNYLKPNVRKVLFDYRFGETCMKIRWVRLPVFHYMLGQLLTKTIHFVGHKFVSRCR